MSPNPAFLDNQRDESFCHRVARRGNHAAPDEGESVGLGGVADGGSLAGEFGFQFGDPSRDLLTIVGIGT